VTEFKSSPQNKDFDHLDRLVRLVAIRCFFWSFAWALWSSQLASATARANVPEPNWIVSRTWLREQGLPQNSVTSILQTHDGYIWVGTYNGFARFDGAEFVCFNSDNTPEMSSSRVTSLFEDSDGALWIGHEGGEVTRYLKGTFRAVSVPGHWPTGRIESIGSDESGDIWVLSEGGYLRRLRDGLVLKSEPGNMRSLEGMVRSDRGHIWIMRNGKVSSLQNESLQPLNFDRGNSNTLVLGIGPSVEGGLWIAAGDSVSRLKDGVWVETRPLGTFQYTPCFVRQIKNGIVAVVSSDKGFELIFPDQHIQIIDLGSGLPSDWVSALAEDREGDLWVGANGAGLMLVRESIIKTIKPPEGWQGRAVLSLCNGRHGVVWIGTEGLGVYRYQEDNWQNYSYSNGLANTYVWSLSEDARGNLWAGSWGGGFYIKDGDQFVHPPGEDNLFLPVPVLLPDKEGGMYAGTGRGLLYYRDGKTTTLRGSGYNPTNSVRSLLREDDGTIWYGTAGEGLFCLSHGTVKQYQKNDGLPNNFIQCLHRDEAGAIWIGTLGGGLGRLKHGQFATISQNKGLSDKVICDIEDDGHGYFWISSYGGIFRVNKTELNRCADGLDGAVHCVNFGISDGMPTLECSGGFQPAGVKLPDGRLWFPTTRGIVQVDPQNTKTNTLPPPVIIEDFLVDDQILKQPSTAGSRLKIAPGNHRFEFRYTALSFVAPEKVSFKYRIEGLDKDWGNAAAKRAANYSFLPPGDYVFHVIACNNDGIWNETGAEMQFTLLPHFWQTLWFRVLGGMFIVAVASVTVWFDTRNRMQRNLERVRLQHAMEQERARIANDIHDDLGSQLTRITMLSESGRTVMDDPKQAAMDLNQIYDTAREATKAMDEIVWAVNPEHDTLESLASYLEKYALDFLGAAGIRCRLDMPLQSPVWQITSEARHNLFLAYKEALNNVAKHSRASEVQIGLTLSPAAFKLDIVDNGLGFDPKNLPAKIINGTERLATGNGLASMNKRLRKIGGICEITSAPNKGTHVSFRVDSKRYSLS
jgi:signal transduction histidine kinase/ligand-binding sensor domain-containing protein